MGDQVDTTVEELASKVATDLSGTANTNGSSPRRYSTMNHAPTKRTRWMATSAHSGTARTQARKRADNAHARSPARTRAPTVPARRQSSRPSRLLPWPGGPSTRRRRPPVAADRMAASRSLTVCSSGIRGDQPVSRVSRLSLHHAQQIGPHYARTLHQWRERFHERLDHVHALGFDARFARMWDLYLAYSEAGFRSGYLDVYQWTFAPTGSSR